MSKARLEALSDGVFSIVMTLFVFQIEVPKLGYQPDALALFHEVVKLIPFFASNFVSFIVLAAFWISHHALYDRFVKSINRQIMLINLLFLFLISLVPFSSHFLGTYHYNETAIIFYGIHLALISLVGNIAFTYVLRSPEIENPQISPRVLHQARVRVSLPFIFSIIGVALSFLYTPLALICFAFPIIFNIIPGSLNFVERIFGMHLYDVQTDEPAPAR